MPEKGGDGMAGEKILIVDDDKNICELLRLYLTKGVTSSVLNRVIRHAGV